MAATELDPYAETAAARPKRRADRREVESRLRELYDWLMRLSDMDGLYTGLDMWDCRSRGESGDIVLIREIPSRVTVTATAVGKVEKIYRDALDLKYAYLRSDDDREVTDLDRAIIAGVSEQLYRSRVTRGRRYTQRRLREIESR